MRLSTFNLYVPDYPASGETLVHNTFSGAFVVLDEEVLAALRKADRREPLTDEEEALASDPDLSDPDVGVVVDSRKAEEAEFRAWFERKRAKRTLDVIVGVNLACNFDCPYCCQAEVMDGSVMRPDTADATADWLVRRALEVGLDDIHLMFVGGEPLLHPRRIVQIATRVRAGIEGRGIGFSFGLITNGYFLTPEIVEELLPLGLTAAQVTLDGDETTHMLTRVSKKGEDTFRRIFDHTIAASRRIRVAVNGNYQPDTIHGFVPLIERLAEAGLAPGASVGFSPALAGLSSADGVGSGACTWSGSDGGYRVELFDETLRRGLDPGGPFNVVGPCEFHDHHAFAIDPDGTIYKCPGFLGHPDWGIGHVERGLTRRYQQMLRLNPQRECSGCAHQPNCGGGCVAAQWLELGRPEGVNCEHSYFESVKEEALVRSYLLATNDDAASAVAQFPPPKVTLPVVDSRGDGGGRGAGEGRRGVKPAALRVVAA